MTLQLISRYRLTVAWLAVAVVLSLALAVAR